MKIISGFLVSSTYLIADNTAAGTSIADKLPALKLNSVGSSRPISSVEITAEIKPL